MLLRVLVHLQEQKWFVLEPQILGSFRQSLLRSLHSQVIVVHKPSSFILGQVYISRSGPLTVRFFPPVRESTSKR